MIRLATVFSGIGAIEHALNRMGIDNTIVFACDNGDVSILSKNIRTDMDEIGFELKTLSGIIEELKFDDDVDALYKDQLQGMLKAATAEFKEVQLRLKDFPEEDNSSLEKMTQILLNSDEIKSSRKNEYTKHLNSIQSGSYQNQRLKELLLMNLLLNDLNNNRALLENAFVADHVETIRKRFETNNGYKMIRRVIDLAQRTSMLHEKINYMSVQKKLSSLGNDWKAQKTYVDNLYLEKASQNKVRQSYLANYYINEEDFHWNVAFLNGKQYSNKVDLFVGGSPCQSFSFVGKKRGLDDTRGTLFYEYARLIDEIRPKVFVYENVRAVINHDGGKTWKKMQQVFHELDYNFQWKVLNARDYGVPQNRERLYVVGFRNDLVLETPFEFPQPIPLRKKMADFLLDNEPEGAFLPESGDRFKSSEKHLAYHSTQKGDLFATSSNDNHPSLEMLEKYFLSEKVRKYVLASGTKNFYSKPEINLEIARPLLTSMHKMHRAGVDNYVTTNGRLRKLAPRECLRLMGFSDSFQIVVSDTSMYQQAGNSIVVDVLICIMKQILKSYPELNGEEN